MDRGIQLLREGHELSGFQQIAAQSQEFFCLGELEPDIERLRSELVNQVATGEMFEQINEKAFLLREALDAERNTIEGGILRTADVQYSRLEHLIRINELHDQIKLQTEVSSLCQLIISGIDAIVKIEETTAAHVNVIADVQQILEGKTQIEPFDFSARLMQLSSIREAVFTLLHLESENALTLLNSNVNYAAQLMSLIKETANGIQMQVLEPATQIWSEVVRERLSEIGEQFITQKYFENNITLMWYNQDNAAKIVKILDFGDKRANEQLLTIVTRTQQDTAELDDTHVVNIAFELLHELIHLSEQLGQKQQLLEKLEEKWKSFFIRISTEKGVASPLCEQYEYIVGFFVVIRQFEDIFSNHFVIEIQNQVVDNIVSFCNEMKEQIGLNGIYQAASGSKSTIHQIIADLYNFRRFVNVLQRLNIVTHIDHIETHINKKWIELFTHHLNVYFSQKFEEDFMAIGNANIPDIEEYLATLNAEGYYKAVSITQEEFQVRAFMLFAEYLDYIYVWLNKGAFLQPPLEVLLTLCGKYPKEISSNTFYEILESFNEFFIVGIIQFFEVRFAEVNVYTEIFKLFTFFTALIPAVKSAAIYIENSTYFTATNIFNEILEIIREKSAKYFQKYMVPLFCRVVEETLRTGEVSFESSENGGSMNGILQESVITAVRQVCEFELDILNNYNIEQFSQHLFVICKASVVRVICGFKRGSVSREIMQKLNELVVEMRKMIVKQNLIEIDEYNAFSPIFSECEDSTLSLIRKYYGIEEKSKSAEIRQRRSSLNLEEINFTDDDIRSLCHWKCGEFIREQEERETLKFIPEFDLELSAFDAALRAFELDTTIGTDLPYLPEFFGALKASGGHRKAIQKLEQQEE